MGLYSFHVAPNMDGRMTSFAYHNNAQVQTIGAFKIHARRKYICRDLTGLVRHRMQKKNKIKDSVVSN